MHNVWELSFDWKECNSTHLTDQKLDYMHSNPCSGKWNLCKAPADYLHSSAKFYLEGIHAAYPVTNIMQIDAVEFEPG